MPGPNDRAAIEQLRKVISRGAAGQAPIQGSDFMNQTGQSPAEANAALYGQPKREDINLPVDEGENPFMRILRQLRQGTLFGVKEQSGTPPPGAQVYVGDKSGVGRLQ